MGIPSKGFDVNSQLLQLIDWYSDDDPITEENTQKVFDLIEIFVGDFCGISDEGPIPLKDGKTPFEVMTFIKDFYDSDRQLCDSLIERDEKFGDVPFESLTEDQKIEYSEVPFEWYDRDKEFGRFPYWLMMTYFDTDLSEGGVQ